MQVNNVQVNNPGFGMALYMKDAKVFKKVLGNNIAKTLEAARPELEMLSKDVDISIKPRRFADNPFRKPDEIGIYVQEKNITLKDRVMRFFNQRPPYKKDTWCDPEFVSTKDDIIRVATRLKDSLLKFIEK